MAITDKQREARRSSIGSSDAAAILGMCPHRTPYDVWAEKTGRVEGFAGNAATERGERLEPVIRRWMAEEMDRRIVQPRSTFRHREHAVLSANVDGVFDEFRRGNDIAEMKSMMLPDGWGEAGTDQVRDDVYLQVQHQMACSDAQHAYVCRLDPFWGFSIYSVPRSDEVIDAMTARLVDWWGRHVVGDEHPEGDALDDRTMQTLGRMRREDDADPVTLDDDEVSVWFKLAEEAREASKLADAYKARLVAKLGDASIGECSTHTLRMGQRHRRSVSLKDIEKHEPRLLRLLEKRGLVNETEYRQLDIKKRK